MRQATIATDERSYVILLQPEPEGGYTVTCPALPGLVTYGETLDEARAIAADAISGYLECLWEDRNLFGQDEATFSCAIPASEEYEDGLRRPSGQEGYS